MERCAKLVVLQVAARQEKLLKVRHFLPPLVSSDHMMSHDVTICVQWLTIRSTSTCIMCLLR